HIPMRPRFTPAHEEGYSVIFSLMTPASRGNLQLASAQNVSSGLPRAPATPRTWARRSTTTARLVSIWPASRRHSEDVAPATSVRDWRHRGSDPICDLRTRVEAELVEDAAHVTLHGALRDEEAGANLFVAEAFGDQPGNIRFPLAQQRRGG